MTKEILMLLALFLLAACSTDMDLGEVYYCDDSTEISIDLNDGLGYPLITLCWDASCVPQTYWVAEDGIIDAGLWCQEVDTIYIVRVR